MSISKPPCSKASTRVSRWLLVTWLLASPMAAGAIYRWEDQQGGTHYSDRPIAGAHLVKVDAGIRWYRVAQVYDGDTLTLDNGDTIRLLGINTPEIASRYRAGEAGGQRAKAWLEHHLATARVRLEYDRQKRDHYGRKLGYLFTEQGIHLNLELIRQGLAMVSLHPPNLRYAQALLAAQRDAEQARRGIWQLAAYQPQPLEEALTTPLRGWQRVIARVQAVESARRYVYLRLSERAAVQIPITLQPLFPPLQSYQGQRLEIRGWWHQRKGQHLVLVRHPGDLIMRPADPDAD